MAEVNRDDPEERRARCFTHMFTKVPYNAALKLELLDADEKTARVRMPFQDFVDNGGTTYHGGAVSSLLDATGSAAAWSGHDFSKWPARGSTVSLTINFVGAGKDDDLIGTARVVRRTKELQFVDVLVESATGNPVASGVLIYRIVA
jgi:uncharacterized protein (TIGR00369 family)